jgi:hypothetical protein
MDIWGGGDDSYPAELLQLKLIHKNGMGGCNIGQQNSSKVPLFHRKADYCSGQRFTGPAGLGTRNSH